MTAECLGPHAGLLWPSCLHGLHFVLVTAGSKMLAACPTAVSKLQKRQDSVCVSPVMKEAQRSITKSSASI